MWRPKPGAVFQGEVWAGWLVLSFSFSEGTDVASPLQMSLGACPSAPAPLAPARGPQGCPGWGMWEEANSFPEAREMTGGPSGRAWEGREASA